MQKSKPLPMNYIFENILYPIHKLTTFFLISLFLVSFFTYLFMVRRPSGRPVLVVWGVPVVPTSGEYPNANDYIAICNTYVNAIALQLR